MVDPAAVSCLTLDVERDGEVAIVRCHGTLVSHAEDPLYQFLYDEVSRPMSDAKRVVLDLSDLSQISDVGLSRLAELAVHARRAGCEFDLFNPQEQPREFLSSTNLTRLFTVRGADGELLRG
jgi:anti-sigma B factor antagonist